MKLWEIEVHWARQDLHQGQQHPTTLLYVNTQMKQEHLFKCTFVKVIEIADFFLDGTFNMSWNICKVYDEDWITSKLLSCTNQVSWAEACLALMRQQAPGDSLLSKLAKVCPGSRGAQLRRAFVFQTERSETSKNVFSSMYSGDFCRSHISFSPRICKMSWLCPVDSHCRDFWTHNDEDPSNHTHVLYTSDYVDLIWETQYKWKTPMHILILK